MSIYGVYDVKEKEQCIRVGTAIEIIKFLNLSARKFDTAIKKKTKINNKYELVYLYDESEKNK